MNMSDEERLLDEQGILEVTNLAQFLKQSEPTPDKIIVSPAKRTAQTHQIVSDTWAQGAISEVDASIYYSDLKSILRIIAHQDGSVNYLTLIGHSPVLWYLTEYLSGELIEIKAAGAVKLELSIDKWTDIQQERGRLAFYRRPE
jgi:phosphohistidine phosphatase